MRMSKNNKLTRKPYPWKCTKCRQSAVYAGFIDYENHLTLDGQRYHIKLNHLETPRCRNCGTATLDSNANRRITRELMRKAKLLSPEQIRKYRKRLKLTEADLSAAIGVATEIIEHWENGLLIQTRPDDNMLRLFFGLPEARELLSKQKLSKVGLVTNAPTKAAS